MKKLGLELGGGYNSAYKRYEFVGAYDVKGCNAYHKGDYKGNAYYGTFIDDIKTVPPFTPAELKSSLEHTEDQYRPQGFDCVEGLHLSYETLSLRSVGLYFSFAYVLFGCKGIHFKL